MKDTSGEKNIIIWVENIPGVLYRIVWLFRKKQVNIESITAGYTQDPEITRITIKLNGRNAKLENIVKQVAKLINVKDVKMVDNSDLVYREMAMAKLSVSDSEEKKDIFRLIEHLRGRVINMTKNTLVIEVTGSEEKIDAFYENLKDYKILEFVRTGRTALFKDKEEVYED